MDKSYEECCTKLSIRPNKVLHRALMTTSTAAAATTRGSTTSIRDPGIVWISEGSISVDLSSLYVGPKHCIAVSEVCKLHPGVRSVSFAGNSLTPSALDQVCQFLEQSRIESINFSCNAMDIFSARRILSVVQQNEGIVKVNVAECSIPDTIQKDIDLQAQLNLAKRRDKKPAAVQATTLPETLVNPVWEVCSNADDDEDAVRLAELLSADALGESERKRGVQDGELEVEQSLPRQPPEHRHFVADSIHRIPLFQVTRDEKNCPLISDATISHRIARLTPTKPSRQQGVGSDPGSGPDLQQPTTGSSTMQQQTIESEVQAAMQLPAGEKYTDPTFPPESSSIGPSFAVRTIRTVPGPDHRGDVCLTTNGNNSTGRRSQQTSNRITEIKWVRLTEMSLAETSTENEDGSDRPYDGFFSNSMVPSAVIPGNLCGGKWVANVLSILRFDEPARRALCIKALPDLGVFAVRVFKNQTPVDIIVDDWVPIVTTEETVLDDTALQFVTITRTLQTCRCESAKDLWAPIIEKAYAKLHGSFERIARGSTVEAMFDFTCSPTFRHQISPAKIGSGGNMLVEKMRSTIHIEKGKILAKATARGDLQRRGLTACGILPNRLYVVVDVRETSPGIVEVFMISLDPGVWWTGRSSCVATRDENAAANTTRAGTPSSAPPRGLNGSHDDVPRVAPPLAPVRTTRLLAPFSILLEDFVAFFDRLYHVSQPLQLESSTVRSMKHRSISAYEDHGGLLSDNVQYAKGLRWHSNQSFLLVAPHGLGQGSSSRKAMPVDVTVTLTQPDRRLLARAPVVESPVRMQLHVLEHTPIRPSSFSTAGEEDTEDICALHFRPYNMSPCETEIMEGGTAATPEFPGRDVSLRVKVHPDRPRLVVCSFSGETPFELNCSSQQRFTIDTVPVSMSRLEVEGKWEGMSAGGRPSADSSNRTATAAFSSNPQYAITSTSAEPQLIFLHLFQSTMRNNSPLEEDKLHSIGIYGKRRQQTKLEVHSGATLISPFTAEPSICASMVDTGDDRRIVLDPNETMVVMPCTWNVGEEGPFTFLVFYEKPTVSVKRIW